MDASAKQALTEERERELIKRDRRETKKGESNVPRATRSCLPHASAPVTQLQRHFLLARVCMAAANRERVAETRGKRVRHLDPFFLLLLSHTHSPPPPSSSSSICTFVCRRRLPT